MHHDTTCLIAACCVCRMYDRMTAMYESGGTRMYRLGRTETIRNTTDQAHAFVRAMQDPGASVSGLHEGGGTSMQICVVDYNNIRLFDGCVFVVGCRQG